MGKKKIGSKELMNIHSSLFYEDVDKLRDFFKLNNHSEHGKTLDRILSRYEELRHHAISIALGHGTSVDFRDALEANTDEKTRELIKNLERWQSEDEVKITNLSRALENAAKTAHCRGEGRFCYGDFNACNNCRDWRILLADPAASK